MLVSVWSAARAVRDMDDTLFSLLGIDRIIGGVGWWCMPAQATSLVFILALVVLLLATVANLDTQVEYADLTSIAVMAASALVCGYLAVTTANSFSLRLVRSCVLTHPQPGELRGH